MLLGTNLNHLRGNGAIATGGGNQMLFHEDATWPWVHDQLWTILTQTNIRRVRSLLWWTERDPVATPWLHIPPSPIEVANIADFIKNSPIMPELAVGCLWEAQWLKEEQGIPLPDNPFKTPQELATALVDALALVVNACKYLPFRMDLYNEMDIMYGSEGQKEAWKAYLPPALELCAQHGIPTTISTIMTVPTSGVFVSRINQRTAKTYRWLYQRELLPRWMEIHINGWTAENIEDYLKDCVEDLVDEFQIPVSVGEYDGEGLTPQSWEAVGNCELKEFCFWN